MNDFIREIQDDIQKQKYQDLWERYGTWLLCGIGAIVLAAGGWQITQYINHQAYIKDTDQLLNAVKAPDVAAFKAASDKTDGIHQGFADLIQAQLLEGQENREESEKKLAALAASKSDALPYDLARALSTTTDKPADIFRFTALERSGWQAIEVGDMASASKAFEAIIQAEDVPFSITDRAKSGLAYVRARSDQKE